MAQVKTDDKHYTAIANAIRDRAHSQVSYTPEQMAQAVHTACDTQYQEGIEAGHSVKSGTFTVAEDTNKIALSIPAGAKLVEIIPEEMPSESATTSRVPVCYVFASSILQDNNPSYEGCGAMTLYYYGSRYYSSFYAFQTDDGFSTELATGLIFEANMPYRWTAHYW